MRQFKVTAAALGLTVGVLAATPASAWNRGNVQVLTVLPDLIGQPQSGTKSSVEGLTVGPDGNIYVPTFGFNATPPGFTTGPANLFVISPNGRIVRQVTIANSSPHILGLRFNPATGALWVLDFGAGKVLNVDPVTGNSSVLAGPIAGSGLNALTFDSSGNGYVSDSFNGAIWKIPSGGGTPSTPWVSDPLLGPGMGPPTPFLTPPFGANGVEFNNEGTILFVANTAFHQIIQIPVTASGGVLTPGTPSIFITGINAPDGIMIDGDDNIWICANQEDEIVVVDKTGKVIAKLGDFEGIDPKGIARGLLFPASLAFSNDKSILYVSNLTLFLPFATGNKQSKAIDSDWTLQVQGYTVSKLPAKIPPIAGD
jgi:sugar lactone lactonase YvrE